MLFRPLHTVLVAAFIYPGGLGAASAPVKSGDELSSIISNLGRSASDTANDGALAHGDGLQHSQMHHHESFGRQSPDTKGAFHQDAGKLIAHNAQGFNGPFDAAQHPYVEYGSVLAYPLHTYGTPGYAQHSGLSIESSPSLPQQQEEFGHPGIPPLDANQLDQFHTAYRGNEQFGHPGIPPLNANQHHQVQSWLSHP
ncbi:hypothetical protein ACQY0O_007855 [Thecaphora frezii]